MEVSREEEEKRGGNLAVSESKANSTAETVTTKQRLTNTKENNSAKELGLEKIITLND